MSETSLAKRVKGRIEHWPSPGVTLERFDAREYVEAAALDLEPFPTCTAKRSLSITACYMVNRDQ